MALAVAAEYAFEHPLTRAVVQGAKERGAEVRQPQDFQALSGFDVEGTVEGQQVRVGKSEWFVVGLLPPEVAARAQELAGQGKTVTLVAVEDEPQGLLAVADQEKPRAAQSLSELQGLGWLSVFVRDLHPVMAAGAMVFSSVIVVINSLRLGRAKLG